MKGKKNSSLIVIGIIAVIVAVILGYQSSTSTIGGIGRVLLTIGFIVLVLIVVFVIIMLALAFRSSHREAVNPAGNRSSSGRGSGSAAITAEEEQLLTSGRKTLGEIRVVLARIKDVNIRDAGTDVCKEIDKILAALKEDPGEISKTRQFLRYYIPTLSDILNKYFKLEQNGMADQDMKDKMTGHLNGILAASNKQYKNLFEDDKLDLTVDMKVLEMACRSDGLLSDSAVKNDESDITLTL